MSNKDFIKLFHSAYIILYWAKAHYTGNSALLMTHLFTLGDTFVQLMCPIAYWGPIHEANIQ